MEGAGYKRKGRDFNPPTPPAGVEGGPGVPRFVSQLKKARDLPSTPLTKRSSIMTIRIIRISIGVNVTTSPPAPPADARPVVDAALPSGEFETPIRSKELFKERACIYIEHEGMIYALRSTRAGKLILTK
ncbi:MAG: hemin uptake protein HemP [Zoogloea sp.]|nr:hemin uptake protein HemP [Zoogloea sp.]